MNSKMSRNLFYREYSILFCCCFCSEQRQVKKTTPKKAKKLNSEFYFPILARFVRIYKVNNNTQRGIKDIRFEILTFNNDHFMSGAANLQYISGSIS